MNCQRDVTLFATQAFGEVEQKGADRGEGLVAIGNEGFIAGVWSNAEKRG